VTSAVFLELGPFQWLAIILAMGTGVLFFDALVGHYRHRFGYRLQYAPLAVGTLVILAAVLAAARPSVTWVITALEMCGWGAAVTGLVGFGYHWYYGIVKKPAGLAWFLHYLMYGAPLLFPLMLTSMGLLAVIVAAGLSGARMVFGAPMPTALCLFVAVVLLGSILQAGILHYRGAFNNPAMYLPLSIPVVTVAVALWVAESPSAANETVFAILLWSTLLIGFTGFGMHLRGIDRQMGGLYVALFNLMQGPPQGVPGIFVALAGVGLVAVYLL